VKFERGSVLIETALTAGIGLTILLFGMRVGVLGFLQITADAAAFVDAHAYDIGVPQPYASPEDYTHSVFPQVLRTDISGVAYAAPHLTIPIDYWYNSPWWWENQYVTTNRHAGFSIVEPLHYINAVVPHASSNVLGSFMAVTGISTEPKYVECQPHYNIASSAADCGQTGQPANYQIDYFSQGENTPPYYVGTNYMQHCTLVQPWPNCPAASTNFLSLGVGEYLDVNNWAATTAGAGGTGMSGLQPVSTFEYMACHQRVYSALSTFFQKYKDLPTLYVSYQTPIQSAIALGISDYRNWQEFSNYLSADANIREVYKWDTPLAWGTTTNTATEPGAFPMTPGLGC